MNHNFLHAKISYIQIYQIMSNCTMNIHSRYDIYKEANTSLVSSALIQDSSTSDDTFITHTNHITLSGYRAKTYSLGGRPERKMRLLYYLKYI